MKIRLRYFASLREIVGQGEEILTVLENTQVVDVRSQLVAHYPRLQPIIERCACAINHNYVSVDAILHDNDELVFIPPMGGGSGEMQMDPLISLTREPLNRDMLVAAITHPSMGGIVVFEGVVRDNSLGKQVRYLEYDLYKEMAEQQIRTIITEAKQRWGVERVAVAHRFGRLEIGETSVIIAVASPHRAEAFDACRYIIDTLKTTVPIWKKEVATDGEEWISSSP